MELSHLDMERLRSPSGEGGRVVDELNLVRRAPGTAKRCVSLAVKGRDSGVRAGVGDQATVSQDVEEGNVIGMNQMWGVRLLVASGMQQRRQCVPFVPCSHPTHTCSQSGRPIG